MSQPEETAPTSFKLDRAPIVEAVFDLDCDLPQGFALKDLEDTATQVFGASYPIKSHLWVDEVVMERHEDASLVQRTSRALGALRFHAADNKQLIQVRQTGFSFNRLSPYGSFDDYLDDIEEAWRLYVEIANPVLVREVRLRYINRIELPSWPVELTEYFLLASSIPWEDGVTLRRFLAQYVAIEQKSSYMIKTTLADVPEASNVPVVIFDIEVWAHLLSEPADWPLIQGHLQGLRRLKNRIFKDTLTKKCLQLFRDYLRLHTFCLLGRTGFRMKPTACEVGFEMLLKSTKSPLSYSAPGIEY